MSKKESYKLVIPIGEYLELLNEIEKVIPKSKTVSYWKILGILENNRKIINPVRDKLYF